MLNQDIVRCSEVLIAKELTIAFAESASGGRMAAEFSMVPSAGKFLKGSFVCYDAALKQENLGVSKALIDEHTPESMEVTEAITIGVRKLINADIHIGITGLPAPGGSETTEKPVGTIFVHAIYNGGQLFSERRIFDGEPEEIILKAVYWTAELLVRHLDI